MAQEINEGTAYLMALRHATGAASATATAPAQTASSADANNSASTNTPFRGVEKRRSVRHQCEGSAVMREEGCEVRSWATFTDISLHGCYVEAQATYPVGTILHMRLELNGKRVDAKGNVRVNYPYLGMGIAFVDMTEDMSSRLGELVRSISRSYVKLGASLSPTLQRQSANAVPLITDPQAAVQELIRFFDERPILMREEFLRLLRKSQTAS